MRTPAQQILLDFTPKHGHTWRYRRVPLRSVVPREGPAAGLGQLNLIIAVGSAASRATAAMATCTNATQAETGCVRRLRAAEPQHRTYFFDIGESIDKVLGQTSPRVVPTSLPLGYQRSTVGLTWGW